MNDDDLREAFKNDEYERVEFVRCYLCHERRPQDETEVTRYRVASSARGGTVQGVYRYVRMCRSGFGCKATTEQVVALLRRYVHDEGLCDNEIARLTSDLPAGSCRPDSLCFYCTAKAFLAAHIDGAGASGEVGDD